LLDAKRHQVYAGAYALRNGTLSHLEGPVLSDPTEFLARLPRPLVVLGEGVAYHAEPISAAQVEILTEQLCHPSAREVFELGSNLCQKSTYSSGSQLIPLYIRRPEAEEKWEKLHPPSGH